MTPYQFEVWKRRQARAKANREEKERKIGVWLAQTSTELRDYCVSVEKIAAVKNSV